MLKLIYIAIAVFLSGCFLLGPAPRKRLEAVNASKPIDVAIVPGLPFHHGKWDTLLKARILWSEFLYKKGYIKNIIYSGNAVYSPWIEGATMALFAEQLGIPKEHIFIDTLAEHSTENLFYGYELAKRMRFKTIALATDPFQCNMLYRYAKKQIPQEIIFLPIVGDSIAGRTNVEITIDTNLTKKANFIPLPERQNNKERLRGTRGKNISVTQKSWEN